MVTRKMLKEELDKIKESLEKLENYFKEL